jgi:hypothetical protein
MTPLDMFNQRCEFQWADPQYIFVKETEWDDATLGESAYMLSAYIVGKPDDTGKYITYKYGTVKRDESREVRASLAHVEMEKFFTGWLDRPVTLDIWPSRIDNWIMYDELPVVPVADPDSRGTA